MTSTPSGTPTPYATLREANIARQKEWDAGNQITATYRATELSGELGEECHAEWVGSPSDSSVGETHDPECVLSSTGAA